MVARVKAVIQGSIGTPALDTWSVGLNFSGLGVGNLTTSTELQDWAEDCFALITDPLENANLRSALSNEVTFDRVTCYYYPGPGPAQAVGFSSATQVIGSGAATKPPQCSIVFSLLTGLAGRSFRGRVYWPACGAPMSNSTFKITAPGPQDLADEFAALYTAMASAGSGVDTLFPAVYSPTRDLATPVAQVGVGDVIDTQRRRRDGLVETYSYGDVS